MKGNIAVIGDGDSILVFKAVGVTPFAVTTALDAEKALDKAAKNYKIIFITDDFAKMIDEKISKYTAKSYPIIVSVPSKDGSNGYGNEKLTEAMEKALGINLFPTNGN
ncbi:MAG: V-type ATP synthase subunit F [Clostridia bacterium]|nr:V-type ATP synthase subunit F [Clostridia bacterium]